MLSGARGAVVDLKLSSANKAVDELKAEAKRAGLTAPEIRGYECDVSSKDGATNTFDQIVKDFGKVDVMVTNAGITGGSPAETYDLDDWKQMLDVNVNGTFMFAQAAGKHMIDNKIKGSIILVSSMSGSIVNRPQKQSAYNVVCLLMPISAWPNHNLCSSPRLPPAT